MLKMFKAINLSLGESTMHYSSIFSQLFNFIFQYRFEKIIKKLNENIVL